MLRGQCAEYGTLVGSGGHCLHGDHYLIGGEESEGGVGRLVLDFSLQVCPIINWSAYRCY